MLDMEKLCAPLFEVGDLVVFKREMINPHHMSWVRDAAYADTPCLVIETMTSPISEQSNIFLTLLVNGERKIVPPKILKKLQ
jgi:hypothetical protein